MDPKVTFLFSIGLYVNWVIGTQLETHPRPTLWAIPSPVVPIGTDVTLRCQGQLGSNRFQLWKDRELREEKNTSWELAEFVLWSVNDVRDAKSYRCRSGQGPWWSELSDPLILVVMTGALPEPSIGILPGYTTMSSGSRVTICCQISSQALSQDSILALLKAKSLEPLELQNPVGNRAVFEHPSLRAEDTGSYRCIYYKKRAPYTGSQPSNTMNLIVDGPLPKPTLWARPGLVMAPGSNITLWCSRPKLSAFGEVTFTLWKVGTQEPLQNQTSEDLWTSFLLPSVRPEDTGSYNCSYKERIVSAGESEPSDALELVVPGSLPPPSLVALQGLVVEQGMHVTLQCRMPPWTFHRGVTFSLLKVGTPRPLQSQSPGGSSADFPLLSVRAQDAGNYSCVYYRRRDEVSELSDILEIWVTGSFPKPSLLAWPSPSGVDVTLLCRGPSWAIRFLLYKEGDEKSLSMDTTQNGTQFFLTHVTPKDSGNYSCSYQVSTNGSLWTQHSEPLQLIVAESVPGIILIIISCVSFLLLCLLLLLFYCQGFMGSLQGDNPSRCLSCSILPRSACLLHHPEVSRQDAPIIEEAKEGARQPLVFVAEESQGMFYAQLNQRALNNRKLNPKEKPPEPSFYATVSGN